ESGPRGRGECSLRSRGQESGVRGRGERLHAAPQVILSSSPNPSLTRYTAAPCGIQPRAPPPDPRPPPPRPKGARPMDEPRTLRVSEALREELSEIIGFETNDPRLLAVDVVEVHVSPDGRHANVRVAIRGTEKEQRESLTALEHAVSFIRHEVAMRLSLR